MCCQDLRTTGDSHEDCMNIGTMQKAGLTTGNNKQNKAPDLESCVEQPEMSQQEV